MKAVLRELAQAKRHYSKLPFFEFLRTDSIPARDRLAFYPCMAPYALAYSDLCRFVLRDESSDDPYQAAVNDRTYEVDHHWSWYLEDFTRLGFDRSLGVTQVLRMLMKEDARESRLLAPRLAQLLQGANAIEKLVVLESLDQADDVFFDATARIADQLAADGGPDLRYLGQFQYAGAKRRTVTGLHPGLFEAIALTSLERVRCLDLSFRVFDLFADWSAELLGYAKNSLVPRSVPHIVHFIHGGDERALKRLS